MPCDSNWNTPEVSAGMKDLFVGRWIVKGQSPAIEFDAAILLDQLQSVVENGERGEPRKSIFSSPIFSMAFMSKAVTISSFLSCAAGRGR